MSMSQRTAHDKTVSSHLSVERLKDSNKGASVAQSEGSGKKPFIQYHSGTLNMDSEAIDGRDLPVYDSMLPFGMWKAAKDKCPEAAGGAVRDVKESFRIIKTPLYTKLGRKHQ